MNPFIGFDPINTHLIFYGALEYWLTFATLLVVVVAATYRKRREQRHPLRRLETKTFRSSVWSLPILVWALQNALSFTRFWDNAIETPFGIRPFSYAFEIALFESFLALAVLVILQIIAVRVLEPRRMGVGVRGHFRVAVIYAVMAIVLDGFLVLSSMIGRWPWHGRLP